MSLLLRSSRLAVLALAAATGAHAAELGDASVRSHSGQPLSADIELTDLTAQELADLQVRLARPDVFQGANVKMNPALAGAQITLARRDNRRVLQVSTSAPVQGEVLHLYFQLVSGGKERVRGVTLWLSPAPTPAPAPAAIAATPAAALPAAAGASAASGADRSARPAARLVVVASPGKEATAGEREMLAAVERAVSSRGGRLEPAVPARTRPAPGEREIRSEALKHASTADDFKRHVKSAKAVVAKESEPEPRREVAREAEPEKQAPQRSFLPSKAALAEAARATRASVEGTTPPAVKAVDAAPHTGNAARPADAKDDPAMLNKLVELEGKLKSLQAQLAMTSTAGAARVSLSAPGKADAAPGASPAAGASATVKTPDVATMAAAAASVPEPAAKPVAAPAVAEGSAPAAGAHDQGEPAARPEESPKAKPEVKKEAAPPPPEPKKEIKISRPKLLTFLFAGSLVLLAIFGVIVHFIRKAKLKRSPIVRQSWSREEDDVPARIEPAIAAPAQQESQAA